MKKAFIASAAMAFIVLSSMDSASALTNNNPYTSVNSAAKVTVLNQFMTRIAQKGESFNDLDRYSAYLSTKISQLNTLNARFAHSANHTSIIGYLLYEFNALFNDVSARKAAADSQEDIDTLLVNVTEGGTATGTTGLPLIQNVRSVTTGNSTVSVFSWDPFANATAYRIFLTDPSGTVRQIAQLGSTSLYLNTAGYATGAYRLGIEALNSQLAVISTRTESLFGLGTAVPPCLLGTSPVSGCTGSVTGTTSTATGTPITDFRYTIANATFSFVWNSFPNASKYRLYHVTDAGAENMLAEVATNAYVLPLPSGFPSGTYRIRLQAFDASGVAISQKMGIAVVYVAGTSSAGGSDGVILGGSTTGSSTTGTTTNSNLPSVTGLTARSQGSSILVSWNDLPGTARYKLYSVNASGAATLLSEVPGLSYFWSVNGINITGYKLRIEAINSAGTVISNAVESGITY